jgi:outer membrane protein X
MKKIALITVCIAVFTAQGFAQNLFKGEKGISSIGLITGYGVDSEVLTVGLDYRYNIKDQLRLAPSVLYMMKKDDLSTWYFNADAHYLLRASEKVTLYPIGGIGLSYWKYKKDPLNGFLSTKKSVYSIDLEDTPYTSYSASKFRIGLNLGFGAEMRITKDLILGAEFKYNLTSRLYNQAMLLARVAYYF